MKNTIFEMKISLGGSGCMFDTTKKKKKEEDLKTEQHKNHKQAPRGCKD